MISYIFVSIIFISMCWYLTHLQTWQSTQISTVLNADVGITTTGRSVRIFRSFSYARWHYRWFNLLIDFRFFFNKKKMHRKSIFTLHWKSFFQKTIFFSLSSVHCENNPSHRFQITSEQGWWSTDRGTTVVRM